MAGTIIDNGGTGFSTVGTWPTRSGYGGYSNAFLNNNNGTSSAYALWTFTGLTASSTYWLAISWGSYGGSGDWSFNFNAVPWKIFNGTGTGGTLLASGTIDQTVPSSGEINGGVGFLFLGSVTPASTSLTVQVLGVVSGRVIADAALLHPAADPITYGTVANGDWSSSAIWSGSHVPVSGDYCALNNAVTITSDQVCGDGTANTVLSCSSNSGTLTITGAKLTIRGNAAIGVYNGGTVRDVLVVNPSGSTQAGIVLYGNSGVTPTITRERDTRFVFNGTNSGHCYLRSAATGKGDASSNAGSNGLVDQTGGARSGYWLCTYTDFYKLGDATHDGIDATFVDSGVTNNTCYFSHCTFDTCGRIPNVVTQGSGGDQDIEFLSSSWTNSLAGTSNNGCVNFALSSGALTTGTRKVDSCLVMSRAQFFAPRDMTITSNYFHDSFNASSGVIGWASFDGNLINRAVDDGDELISAGPMTNNYFYTTQTAANYILLISSAMSSDNSRNVAEYGGSGAICWLGETEETGGDVTLTFAENIAFLSGGGSFDPVIGPNSNPGNTGDNLSTIDHNTFITNGKSPIRGPGTVGFRTADDFQHFRANILVNAGSATGTYAFENNSATNPYILNTLSAANTLANCTKGLATVPAGTFASVSPVVSGASTCTDGTVYYSPMNGATAPGAGDLASTDPLFADTTRTLATWGGTTAGGGVATVAGALATLQANPALVKQATTGLLAYVRAGYAPTNVALNHASYAGDTSWTDAAGTVVSGVADIGAMAYQSTGNRRRRLISTGTY